MPSEAVSLNVSELVDQRPLGTYQLWILAICVLIALMDGFSELVITICAPPIAAAFHLTPAQLGAAFSATSCGFLIGALVFGPCADRWGRRRFLIASELLFSACTFVTPLALGFRALLGLRFVTGLGLGCAAPCFVSTAAEYVPRQLRARLVTMLWAAVPTGGVIVSFIGPLVLPRFGWQALFYGGGAVGLLVGVLALVELPESLVFMITHGAAQSRIRRVVMRVAPDANVPSIARFFVTEEAKPGTPFRYLFSERRSLTTLLLGIAYFINFFVLSGLSVWTPALLKQAEMSVGKASVAAGFFHGGGVVGTFVAGWLVERDGPYRMLTLTLLAGALSACLTGYAAPSLPVVALLATVDGLMIAAALAGLIAFTTILYPAYLRSTALGWGLGFGRLGGASAPLFAGLLVAASYTPAQVFLVFGLIVIPAVFIVMMMRLLTWYQRPVELQPYRVSEA